MCIRDRIITASGSAANGSSGATESSGTSPIGPSVRVAHLFADAPRTPAVELAGPTLDGSAARDPRQMPTSVHQLVEPGRARSRRRDQRSRLGTQDGTLPLLRPTVHRG